MLKEGHKPDIILSENKYLNPCSFVSKHAPCVVKTSITRIRPRVLNTGHVRVEETSMITTEKDNSPSNTHKERVRVLRRFRHTCQGMCTLVLWHDKHQCQKIMNQPYAALTDATGKDQRFKAKSNGVVHGG